MSQVLELAKQGDTSAIAALINRSLTPQGIKARVVLQNGTLKVLLESLEAPNQDKFTNYILQGLRKIGIDSATELEIFGKQSGSEGYAWTQAFQISGDQFTPIQTRAAAPNKPTAAQTNPPATDSGEQPTLAEPGSFNPFTASPFSANQPNNLGALDAAEIKNLAKQGNLDAIAAFVKQALGDREGLESFVEIEGSVLKVTIETKQFLDGPAFCGEFGTKMNALFGGVIQEVAVYKRKSEKTMPFLMKQMTLFSSSASASSPSNSSQSSGSSISVDARSNGQSSAMRSPSSAAYAASSPSDRSIRGSKARPNEVTWIAILYFFLGGLATVLGGMGVLGTMAMGAMVAKEAAEAGETQVAAAVGGIILIASLLALLVGVGRIIVGIGLMQMKKWSRIGVFILEVLSIIDAVLNILSGKIFSFWKIGFAVKIIQYITTLDDELFT